MKIIPVAVFVFIVLCSSGEAALTVSNAVYENVVAFKIAGKFNSLLSPVRSLWSNALVKPKVDLMLLLDSSGSIGAANFVKAKDASKVVVDFIESKAAPISLFGSRAALIEFSSPAKTHKEFGFGTYTTAALVKDAIGSVNYDFGPSTATFQALTEAKAEFTNHGLPGRKKVVWTVTDGRSNTGGNPKVPADVLRSMGTTMCAVGVGSNINDSELNDIADADCIFKVTSYQMYLSVMNKAFGLVEDPLGGDFFSGINFSGRK